MASSKTNMPSEQKKKCSIAIHSATAASTLAGAIPLPIADAIPISAAQITMIIALGKVFDMTISKSAAKSIAGVGLAITAGRTVASSVAKLIPGVGSVVGAATAAAITEALGWIVADDFYRISIGKEPEDIIGAANELKDFGSKF